MLKLESVENENILIHHEKKLYNVTESTKSCYLVSQQIEFK